jgi:hypothetical protein
LLGEAGDERAGGVPAIWLESNRRLDKRDAGKPARMRIGVRDDVRRSPGVSWHSWHSRA